MGLFSGIKVAKMMVSATYVGAGHFIARIDNIKHGDPSNNTGTRKREEFLAIELTVIALLPTNEAQTHRIGDEVCHFIKVTGNEYFLPDFKQFIVGTLNVREEEVDEATCDWAISKDQPLKGTVVELDNRLKTTKEGKNFTKVKYMWEIKPSEVITILPPELKTRFFPNNWLETRAAAEAAQAKPAA